eukprot:3558974-Pleurochrysis_carterae.AAC.1
MKETVTRINPVIVGIEKDNEGKKEGYKKGERHIAGAARGDFNTDPLLEFLEIAHTRFHRG